MTNEPVATTLVRLISEDGNLRGGSITDASGFYSIDVPGPGIYRLEGEMLGYENFLTPPLEVRNRESVHPVDLLLKRSPLLIESLIVSVELPVPPSIDVGPNSFGYKPIQFEDIQDHIGWGRDLRDALRRPIPGRLLAFNTTESPCFSPRSSNCLPVPPNGMHLSPDFPTDGLEGPYEEYYENGQLKTKGTIRDGEVEGRWEEYYEDGQLMTKRTYKAGGYDGPYERYDENGQLQMKGTYKDGVVDGWTEEYYENGRLKTKGTYTGGYLDGPWEEYYENGRLMTKGTYKDGDRAGGWEEYYENGQLQMKRTYNAGGGGPN